jgi:two-component system nitrate/nitrite response regulator NarL
LGISGPKGAAVRVLVVEDHEILASLLSHALEREGFEVTVADNLSAEGILATADRVAPTVAVLDLCLEDGATTLPVIGPLRDRGVTVLVLTALMDDRALGDCLAAGAAATIRKTEPLRHTMAAVRDAVAGRDPMPEGRRVELMQAARRMAVQEGERLEPFAQLTPREQAVLGALMDGAAAEKIATEGFVSLATVRTQIRSILAKLECNSQREAVTRARDAGWTP